jgi:hypothetical protein
MGKYTHSREAGRARISYTTGPTDVVRSILVRRAEGISVPSTQLFPCQVTHEPISLVLIQQAFQPRAPPIFFAR